MILRKQQQRRERRSGGGAACDVRGNGKISARMKSRQTGAAGDVTATVYPSVDVEKTNLEANVSKQSLVQKGFFDDFFLRHFFIDGRKERLPPRYVVL